MTIVASDASTINMGNSHVTIVNDPSSGVTFDDTRSVDYDRNSFIIQATIFPADTRNMAASDLTASTSVVVATTVRQ